jgi:hypothetical protein
LVRDICALTAKLGIEEIIEQMLRMGFFRGITDFFVSPRVPETPHLLLRVLVPTFFYIQLAFYLALYYVRWPTTASMLSAILECGCRVFCHGQI